MVNSSIPQAEISSPSHGFGNNDFVTILHKYVGMGHYDGVQAGWRFDYMFAKITGDTSAPEPSEFLRKKLKLDKADRHTRNLTERVTLVESTRPSLEEYLRDMEEIGEEMMRIAIDGQYTHTYEPAGGIPIPVRIARAGYFGRKLFAHMILVERMKTWQTDAGRGRYNPVRDMFDFVEAERKLSEYQVELIQLLAKASLEYPPSETSDVEKSFMGFLQLPISQRLSLLFGGR